MGDDVLTSLSWLTSGQRVVGPPLELDLESPLTPPTSPTADPTPNPPLDYRLEPVKPPYSYAQLIALAMKAHGGHKVVLTDIYAWIRDNFAFFRGSDNSWQNSIRHNLSLNRQFIKVPRDANDKGKGSYWMLDPKSFRKDPYCIRRRNFFESQSKKPKVSVDRPQINPAVKTFLAKAKALKHSRKHPFSGTGEKLEDIGAQECVVTDEDPQMGDNFNQRRFKKEVETYSRAGGSGPGGAETANAKTGRDERVKVEFNWEGYEYHPSNVVGASLPTVQLSPMAGTGTISLSPPNSDEGQPALDLHIPGPEIPDWWSSATSTTPSLLSPPASASVSVASYAEPLARVFELRHLTTASTPIVSPTQQGGPTFSLLSPLVSPPIVQTAPLLTTTTTVLHTASPPTSLPETHAGAEKEGSPFLDVESDEPEAGIRILAPAQL